MEQVHVVMRAYPAAVTCLTSPIGCVDLLLDMVRVISGKNVFLLRLDDLDMVVVMVDVVTERGVIVYLPLHRWPQSLFPFCDKPTTFFSHGVCRALGLSRYNLKGSLAYARHGFHSWR